MRGEHFAIGEEVAGHARAHVGLVAAAAPTKMGDENGEGQPQQHDGDQRDYAREDQGRDYAREDQGRDRSRSRSRDREPGPGKERGIALRWNQEKGFGFIKPDSGGDDLFCHFSCVEGGNMLKEGSEVPHPCPLPTASPPASTCAQR